MKVFFISNKILNKVNTSVSLFRTHKTSVAFIGRIAAYDTVWKEGLIYKLLKVIWCLKMCHLINNLLTSRLCQIFVNFAKSSTRELNNGLPQGLVLVLLLFNLYTADVPETRCRKFAYAVDLVISQSQILAKLNDYFKNGDYSHVCLKQKKSPAFIYLIGK